MSGYVDKHLQAGEVVTYRGRPSKSAVFFQPTIFLILFVILDSIDRNLSAKTATSESVKTGFEVLLGFALFLLILLVVMGFIAGFVFINSAEYAVTDRRLIAKYGLFRRRSVDVLLAHISGVKVNQGLFGRGLDFGDLLIFVSGGNRQITCIKQPQEFRAAVLTQLEQAKLLRGTAAYRLNTNSGPDAKKRTPDPHQAPHRILNRIVMPRPNLRQRSHSHLEPLRNGRLTHLMRIHFAIGMGIDGLSTSHKNLKQRVVLPDSDFCIGYWNLLNCCRICYDNFIGAKQ